MNYEASIAICMAIRIEDEIRRVPTMLKQFGFHTQDELMSEATKYYREKYGERFLDEFVKDAPNHRAFSQFENILGYKVYADDKYQEAVFRVMNDADGFYMVMDDRERNRAALKRLIPQEDTTEWHTFKTDPSMFLKRKATDKEWETLRLLIPRDVQTEKWTRFNADPAAYLNEQVN